MVMTFGARGDDGANLVRDVKKFKKNMEQIDFKNRDKKEPARVKGGKKTFVYGK